MPLSGRPIMPHSARLPGQLGWRAIMAAGGSARARVPARRSASSGRYRPAMCHTRSAEYAAGIPAAVTDNGRTEDPRTTGTAWWLYGTGTWPRRSPGCRTRRLARPARPRLDRHSGDLAGSRRREHRRHRRRVRHRPVPAQARGTAGPRASRAVLMQPASCQCLTKKAG
jgi:hypothetical protein